MPYQYRTKRNYSKRYRKRNPYRYYAGKAVYNNGVRSINAMQDIAREVVKTYVNTEWKHKNSSTSTVSIPNDGSGYQYILLNGLAEGPGRNERTGQQCKIKTVDVRLNVEKGGTQTANRQIRVMLVRAKFNTAGALDPDNIVAGSMGGTQLALLDFYDTDNIRQYQVMYDRVHRVNVDGADPEEYNIKIHREFKQGLLERFDNQTSAEGSISYGGIFLIIAYDAAPNGGTSTDYPIFSYQTRVKYIDN